jgi:hypothetical protein
MISLRDPSTMLRMVPLPICDGEDLSCLISPICDGGVPAKRGRGSL